MAKKTELRTAAGAKWDSPDAQVAVELAELRLESADALASVVAAGLPVAHPNRVLSGVDRRELAITTDQDRQECAMLDEDMSDPQGDYSVGPEPVSPIGEAFFVAVAHTRRLS